MVFYSLFSPLNYLAAKHSHLVCRKKKITLRILHTPLTPFQIVWSLCTQSYDIKCTVITKLVTKNPKGPMPMKYMRMHVRKMAKAQVIITSLLRTDISCIVYKSPSSHIRVNHTLVKRRKKKIYIYIYSWKTK